MPAAERPPSCCARSPCASSWSAPARRSRASRSAIATPPTSCRSATTSTACRSRSSSPPRASGACRRASSRGGWGSRSACSARSSERPSRAARRWRARSTGATGCSTPTRRPCCAGSGCSPARSTSRRSRRCAGARTSVDVLGRLVRKSLVVAEEVEGEPRYRLLEMIRQYARERLAEAGETDAPGRAARALVPRPAGARGWRPAARRGCGNSTWSPATCARRSAGCSSTTRPRRCASPTRSATGG